MYVLQNTAVALSALCALISLHSAEGSAWFWAGAICTIGIGSISSVGAQGSSLSVEKEWTVILCKGDSAVLAKLNSGKRLAYVISDASCTLTGFQLLSCQSHIMPHIVTFGHESTCALHCKLKRGCHIASSSLQVVAGVVLPMIELHSALPWQCAARQSRLPTASVTLQA